MSDSFPRQYARTRGFNLGLPRSFQIAEDGSRVAFLRTPAGDDPHACLWVYDVGTDVEREIYGPGSAEEHLTQAEIDRRERTGERQSGVVSYASDPNLTIASFVVSEDLLVADLVDGGARRLDTPGSAARSDGSSRRLRQRRRPPRDRPRGRR
jgi:dipeptidyl-peptidase 4